jgi:hypothetical protein
LIGGELDMRYLTKKEVRLIAKPIPATPELKGQDLRNLVKDLYRPDNSKELRERAVNSLRKVCRSSQGK